MVVYENFASRIGVSLLDSRLRSAATASIDDGKTALVDASLRELLAFRDSLTGQPSQRRQLES